MKKAIIQIHTNNIKLASYYINSYENIFDKYNSLTYIFSKSYKKDDIDNKNELIKKGIYIYKYKNYNDLKKQIYVLNKKIEIFAIEVFNENLVNLSNKVKKDLWFETTTNPKLFRNKTTQRKLLFNYEKNLTVNYLEDTTSKLDYKTLSSKFSTWFILKDKDWFESSWVAKINSEKDLEIYISNNNKNKKVLVEEFVDWDFYNIVYFVNKNEEVFLTPPMREIVAIEYNINDFFSPVRIASKESIKNLISKYDLKKFIKENVKACNIKNTFVHHEFKLNSKWELKTIELNWRIWWYRLEMYKEAYGINLLEIPFSKKDYFDKDLENNFAVFALYPERNWTLKSYNYDLIDKIKKLKSFFNIRILPEKYEWKEIWLTKYWFKKVWGIKLKNKDNEQFKKDYDFIKDKYKDLLILE